MSSLVLDRHIKVTQFLVSLVHIKVTFTSDQEQCHKPVVPDSQETGAGNQLNPEPQGQSGQCNILLEKIPFLNAIFILKLCSV